MADSSVAVTAGSGTTIDTRTEATNGNHRQVIVVGDPSTNAGVAPVDATAGLKVDLGADNDVTVTGTVTANLSATDNTVLDNIDTSNAAIKTAVEIIDNAISGSEMQVDVVAALPAGDNNIGNVDLASSIPAGTNNIGDVDVLSLPAIPAGNNNIGDVDIASIAAGDNNIGNVDIASAIPAGTNNIGDVDVLTLPAIPAGNNNIGDVDAIQSGTWTVQPGNTANTTPWLVSTRPSASGGLDIFRSLDLDETEEDVKTSAGQVFGWFITNLASSARYIKFYNATAANVSVGTTTPVLTIPLEADQAANVSFTHGIAFSTAISVAATTGLADNDTGAPGGNEVVVNIFYK